MWPLLLFSVIALYHFVSLIHFSCSSKQIADIFLLSDFIAPSIVPSTQLFKPLAFHEFAQWSQMQLIAWPHSSALTVIQWPIFIYALLITVWATCAHGMTDETIGKLRQVGLYVGTDVGPLSNKLIEKTLKTSFTMDTKTTWPMHIRRMN